jgi:hypothetical protein
MKLEGVAKGVSMAKKPNSKSGRSVCRPNWKREKKSIA